MLRGAEPHFSGAGLKMGATLFSSLVSFESDEDPRQLSQGDEKVDRLITLKPSFDVFLTSGTAPNTNSRSCRCSVPL